MLRGREQPRVFTPPLRDLTPETTLGFLFIEFCSTVCGVDLLPWQRFLAIHGLEIIGDIEEEWTFRFRIVVVLVSRQNGKSKFLALLNLFFLYVLGIDLSVGTAQNLDTAEEVWSDAVDIAEAVQDLNEQIEHVDRVNGKKALRLVSGSRYKIVAASRKGGRGLSAELVSLDELREQTDWEAWGAVTKTTMARPNAQIWCFSNAGDAKSVVLRKLRLQCHAEVGDPDGAVKDYGFKLSNDEDEDGGFVGLFEWSAAPGCSIYDREAWAQANPSLGYGFLTERALAAAVASDPEPVFRTECLCQWVDALTEHVFPEGSWERGTDPESSADIDADLCFGLDVSGDRTMTAIAVCGRREDGDWHVEVVKYASGFKWAIEWLKTRAAKLAAKGGSMRLAVQGKGAPASSHVAELDDIYGLEVVQCIGVNVGAWSGRFYDGVSACADIGDATPIRHRPQPALDVAATAAQTRPLGDGAWGFDRKGSPEDISPLVACALAHGMASEPAQQVEEPKKRQYESAYATGRSFVMI